MEDQYDYDFLSSPELLNKIADIQHEIWAHWMRYLFSVSIHNEDGAVIIPVEKVERWKRQLSTAYDSLTENEQQSDKDQAEKVLNVIRDELNGLSPTKTL